MRETYQELDRRLSEGEQCMLATDNDGKEAISNDGPFVTRFSYPVHLILLGGGHIARSLSSIASLMNIETTVVDDRKDVLTRQAFPGAHELICTSFDTLLERLFSIPNPYWCIFTHGHEHDTECLIQVCRRKAGYIGMIGSRRKIDLCFKKAEESGIDRSVLDNVHSPIGCAINAVTPAEIAISIMAEIISTYRSDKKTAFASPDLVRRIASSIGTVVRVLSSDGSSPAREGAMMLVENGVGYGTVGGGELERLATEEASRCKKPQVKHYSLSDTGMTCGGDVTLLFSPQA